MTRPEPDPAPSRISSPTLLVLALLLAGRGSARAWESPAPDVVLYTTPALADALGRVAARYTGAHHVPVHLFVSAPDGLTGLLAHRARADLVLADAATIGALAQAGLVRPGSVVGLGRNPFVLVARAGASPADAASLVAAATTVLTDPTTAASFDGAAVLHDALPAIHPAAVIGVADTPTVIATVRGGDRLIGLVQQTEAQASGILPIAVLPGPSAAIQGALVVNGQSGHAGELLAFIAAPQGRQLLRQAGLEPAS